MSGRKCRAGLTVPGGIGVDPGVEAELRTAGMVPPNTKQRTHILNL